MANRSVGEWDEYSNLEECVFGCGSRFPSELGRNPEPLRTATSGNCCKRCYDNWVVSAIRCLVNFEAAMREERENRMSCSEHVDDSEVDDRNSAVAGLIRLSNENFDSPVKSIVANANPPATPAKPRQRRHHHHHHHRSGISHASRRLSYRGDPWDALRSRVSGKLGTYKPLAIYQ